MTGIPRALACLRDRYLWVVLVGTAILLTPLLIQPFTFDNALLQDVGIDLHNGRILYLNVFDHALPGVFYIKYLEIGLLGRSELGERIFELLTQTLFTVVLYHALNRWFSRRLAAFSAFLYAAYYLSAGTAVYGLGDSYVSMIALMLLLCTIRLKTIGMHQAAFLGILTGIAILLRPTSALFAVPVLVYFLFSSVASSRKDRYMIIGSYCSATMLLPAAIFLYYASVPAGLHSVYEDVVLFNSQIYSRLSTPAHPISEIARYSPLLALASYAVVRRTQRRLSPNVARDQLLLIAGFVLCAFLTVAAQGKYYRNHLAPFFCLVTPIAALGIFDITRAVRNQLPRYYARIALGLACTLIRFHPGAILAYGMSLYEQKDGMRSVYEAVYTDSLYGGAVDYRIQDYFKHIPNEASVEVCNFDPLLRLHLSYVGRNWVTGYPSVHMMATPVSYTSVGEPVYTEFQRRWQSNYVDTIAKQEPGYFVLARQMQFWSVKDLETNLLRPIPAIEQLLARRYVRDTTIGGYEIYRLRQHHASYP